MKKYDVDYFIKKFKAIPANQWCTGMYSNAIGDKHCALGHCGYTGQNTKESKALSDLFYNHFLVEVTVVNDNAGSTLLILGKSPKTRILSALNIIKSRVSKGIPIEQ